ncbi:hypothetical protein C7T96_17640 [Nitratireductor sp. StC3]|nr:hypothetical protein C7T96_17640 [Nitratireductor sp. StC3]
MPMLEREAVLRSRITRRRKPTRRPHFSFFHFLGTIRPLPRPDCRASAACVDAGIHQEFMTWQ